ncbi:MAG: DUF6295 family protein [Acidimicrobiales bacterium]
MCTYLTTTERVEGTGLGAGGWFPIEHAVVYFDHPQEAPVEHALCIDFRAGGSDPSARVAVELDARSARTLAESILATLAHDEVRALGVE